jgi:hypothetical protein
MKLDERIRRLEERLPRPKSKVRVLTMRTFEASDGRILSTSITEDSGSDTRPLFAWEGQDPGKRMEFGKFLADGAFEVVHVRIIYTPQLKDQVLYQRAAEAPDQAQDGPAPAQDDARIAPQAQTLAPPCDGQGPNADLAKMSEGELRAEITRLRQRRIVLLMEEVKDDQVS